MAGNAPGRALGTRRGVEHKQTPVIVRHRAPCASCGTLLYPRERNHCRQCATWLAIYARTVEIARMLQAVMP